MESNIVGPLATKSVALIIPDFDHGGEEKRVVFFANNYLKYFKNVYLFAPAGLSNELLDPGVIHFKTNIRNPANILKVVKALKRHNISFLQGHKRATLPYLLAAEKIGHIKSFFNFDNIYLKFNKLCSIISPRNIVYLSDRVAEYYNPFYKKSENKTINMGGDFYNTLTEEERASAKVDLSINNEFVLLSLGRLSEQKNHRLLLAALRRIKERSFICLVAGSGPLEAELKSLAQEYDLMDKVKFLGHRTDIASLLNISDALVQSSVFEGFPNVFIEAASVGLPIIATDVGSSATLISENGLLVQSGDEEALAQSVLKVMDNPRQFKSAAERLKNSTFFAGFHKKEMLKNYLEYYKADLKK